MDSRVTELQRVILLKDQMILNLQKELDIYVSRYGKLDTETLELIHADNNNKTTLQVSTLPPPPPSKNPITKLFDSLTSKQSKSKDKDTTETIKTQSNVVHKELNTAQFSTFDNTRPILADRKPPPPINTLGNDGDTSINTSNTDQFEAKGSNTSPTNTTTPKRTARTATTTCATGKNVILDFVEDSPMFRRQIQEFEDSFANLRTLLKEITTHTKDVVTAGHVLGQHEKNLADELMHRKYSRALFTTSCINLGNVSTMMNEVHEVLTEMQRSRVHLLQGLEGMVDQLLTQFSATEDSRLKDSSDIRKEFLRLADDYETQLGKLLGRPKQNTVTGQAGIAPSSTTSSFSFENVMSPLVTSQTPMQSSVNDTATQGVSIPPDESSASSNSVGTNSSKNPLSIALGTVSHAALEKDVRNARLKYELARFDLVWYINRMDCLKKFRFMEFCHDVVLAYLTHCTTIQRIITAEIEPAILRRAELLAQSKNDFEKDELMWKTQREELYNSLASALQDQPAQYDLQATDNPVIEGSSNVNSIGTANALNPRMFELSFELPIEVISADTLEGRKIRYEAGTTRQVLKQGYLFLRNSLFPARSWKRRWFQIQGGKLYQNKGKGAMDMDLDVVCDLLLSRVREIDDSNNTPTPITGSATVDADNTRLPYCFEIIDANQSRLVLQATSECDRQSWILAARRSTESQLEKQAHRMTVHPDQQALIDRLVRENSAIGCADCGQKPNGCEWVSINIGCFLCIECSGIHRSLGVHVSKIRSLTLDSWEMSLLKLLADHLGSKVVNEIWEYAIPPGWIKPVSSSSREEKSKWIRAKYQLKVFIENSNSSRSDKFETKELEQKLWTAAASDDVHTLQWCIANSVDINACQDDTKSTALHFGANNGSINACLYLLLNGASSTLQNSDGKLPSDIAKERGFVAIQTALN